MVVVAVEIRPDLESSVGEGFCYFADVSFGSAHHLDSGVGEGVDCATADAAADEYVYLFAGEESCQCSVTGVAGGEDFFAYYIVSVDFIDGEFRSVSEVLKDLIVLTSYCYFHNIPLSLWFNIAVRSDVSRADGKKS